MADVVDVEDVLARLFKFTGGTSQVHLCHQVLQCTGDEKSRQPVTIMQVIAGRLAAYENQA